MPRRPRSAYVRRKRLRWIGQGTLAAVAIGLVICVIWWWVRGPLFALAPRSDRNVLLVTIDTLRADALGAYGGRAITPNLDRLAAHGAKFTFAHAHAVVTLASHGSILTGRYPYEHGLRDSTGYRLPPTEPTIATRLKERGFATGGFIGGFPLDHRFGLGLGFDLYDDRVGEIGTFGDFTLPERPANEVVASAVKWIGAQSSKWFAWVHVFDPHAPYQPPAEWQQRFPNDPYLAEVSWTDAALGQLFDAVARQSKPTLVVVTADHGEGLGEHGELTHGLFAYESTLRVPLIVAEIGSTGSRTPRGVTVDRPVRHVDVLPTLLEAIGTPPGEGGLSGASLIPVIDGIAIPDRPSYFEAMTANLTRGWAPLRGVLTNRQKYIDLPVPEHYDLVDDAQEQRNILSLRADKGEVFLNAMTLFSTPNQPKDETGNRYTEADDPKQLVQIEQAMHRARNAYVQGRVSEAIAIYQEVVTTRPGTADAYRHLAFVYWKNGQQAPAIATLETALTHDLTQTDVRIRLAQYLAESGRPERAVALLESDGGDNTDALNALGLAYASVNRTADAIQTFTQALALDPTNGQAHANLGALQLRGREFGAAEASLRRAIELDPRQPGPHADLGSVLAETGRRAEAVAEWTRALTLAPGGDDAARIRKLIDSAK